MSTVRDSLYRSLSGWNTGEPFIINKSGWNKYQYTRKDTDLDGNALTTREAGIIITKPDDTPGWNGEIYIDNITWVKDFYKCRLRFSTGKHIYSIGLITLYKLLSTQTSVYKIGIPGGQEVGL
jgi:hypothetical protein